MFKKKSISSENGKIYYIENETSSNRNVKTYFVVSEEGEEFTCFALSLAESAIDRKVIEQFCRNTHVLENFESPYLLKIFDKILTRTDLFLITTLLEIGTLEDVILSDQQRWGEDTANDFLRQMVITREKITEKNMTGNLISLSSIYIKKGDFIFGGFGMLGIGQEVFPSKFGNYYFLAPEVLDQKPNINYEKADVWSMGVCLYCVIFRRPPFEGHTRIQVLAEIHRVNDVKSLFSMTISLSFEIKNLIAMMLEENPLKRINFKELSEHLLAQFFQPKHVQKYKPTESLVQKISELRNNSKGYESMPESTILNHKMLIDLLEKTDFKQGTHINDTFLSTMKSLDVPSEAKRKNTLYSNKNSNDTDLTFGTFLNSLDQMPRMDHYFYEQNLISFYLSTLQKLIVLLKVSMEPETAADLKVFSIYLSKQIQVANSVNLQILKNKINAYHLSDFHRIVNTKDYENLISFYSGVGQKISIHYQTLFQEIKDHSPKFAVDLTFIESADLSKIRDRLKELVLRFFKNENVIFRDWDNSSLKLLYSVLYYTRCGVDYIEFFDLKQYCEAQKWNKFFEQVDQSSLEQLTDMLNGVLFGKYS
jgi:serine/threonine protein kinase